MDTFALSTSEIALLKNLLRHEVRFMVVGMAAAVLQGAPAVTEDVDLWVENLGSDKFLAAVADSGGFYISPGTAGVNPPMLGPENLRLFAFVTHLHGLGSFDVEYQNSISLIVQGVTLRILPLERIITSKKAANRAKDRLVLSALEATLASLRLSKKE